MRVLAIAAILVAGGVAGRAWGLRARTQLWSQANRPMAPSFRRHRLASSSRSTSRCLRWCCGWWRRRAHHSAAGDDRARVVTRGRLAFRIAQWHACPELARGLTRWPSDRRDCRVLDRRAKRGPGLAAQSAADPIVSAAFWVLKVVFYVGLFTGVGGSFFLAWLAPGRQGGGRTAIAISLLAGLPATPVLVGLQGADALALPLSGIDCRMAGRRGLRLIRGNSDCCRVCTVRGSPCAANAGRPRAFAVRLLRSRCRARA